MALDILHHHGSLRPIDIGTGVLSRTVSLLRLPAIRFAASLRRYHDARAFEGLPYDVLKDIGFPAAGAAKNGKACE